MSLPRTPLIAPSLLAADFGDLRNEISRVEKAGADWLHLDVMDGHFVPNLTFGPFIVSAIRSLTRLPLDTHLMISEPAFFAPRFAESGSNLITFHVEAVEDVARTVREIKALGVKVGLSIKPATPVEVVLPYLEGLDLVLVMSVEPGFGGQKFMPEAVPKIRSLREAIDARNSTTIVQVDGGINPETAKLVRDAGVDVIVAGTSVFRSTDPAAALWQLRA